ncbi:MAG: DUF2852 domain-containing protein [Hyphomicrobiales bacterium]|nr:DUF2852 domain-containing protein [Hyphomicrobiales bacterium]
MSDASAATAGPDHASHGGPHGPRDHGWRSDFGGPFGPPPFLKGLAVGAAFMLCPPLGLAALAYLAFRGRGRCAHRFEGRGPRGFAGMTGNSAFDQRWRDTFEEMRAERAAFADFARQQREERDRADYERFVKERDGHKGA